MILKLFKFNAPIYVSLNAAIDRQVHDLIVDSNAIELTTTIDEKTPLPITPSQQKAIMQLWQFFLHITRQVRTPRL